MSSPRPASGSPTGRPTRPQRSSRRGSGDDLPWGWILLAVVVIGGITAFFGARPAWRKIKAIRAQRFVAEAAAHFEKENWSAGFERTRAALQLAPIDPNVLRHAASAYGRFGSEAAFRYYEPLVNSPNVTLEDRENYTEFCLRMGFADLAAPQVEDLLEKSSPSPRSLVLGSQLALIRRDLPNALRLARDASAKDPGNPTNHFAVASVLGLSKRDTDLAEARKILWPHARATGPLQVRALAGILGIREASREDREEVERILAAKEKRTQTEELLLADARISLDPSTTDRTVDALLQKFSDPTPETTAALANWLNSKQLFHRTRDLLPPERTTKDPQLFRIRFQALLGLRDVRGAYDFLMTENPPGDKLAIEFLRCETAIRLKDQTAVDSHFRALLNLSKRDSRSLRAFIDFANRNRNRALANEALQLLARSPRDAAVALRGLIRNSDATGETWAARDYARKLLALRKDDDAVELQVAYYDLLLKENLDEASATARRLQLAKPEDYNRRAVLALSHLRRGKGLEAMSLVASETPDWNRIPPGIRAITAAVLGAGGRLDGASNVLKAVTIARLKPEERELIKPYVTGNIPVEESPNPTP